MRYNLNLYAHIILPQSRNTNTSPNWLVVRHVLSKVSNHGLDCLIIEWYMIGIDTEDLVPSLSARIFEIQFHVCKGLVDLGVDLAVKLSGLGIPSS